MYLFEQNTKEGGCYVYLEIEKYSVKDEGFRWFLHKQDPCYIVFVQYVSVCLYKVVKTFSILIGHSVIFSFSGSREPPNMHSTLSNAAYLLLVLLFTIN